MANEAVSQGQGRCALALRVGSDSVCEIGVVEAGKLAEAPTKLWLPWGFGGLLLTVNM